MRVGVLTREFPPDVYGGAGVHVEFLVGELRALADVLLRHPHGWMQSATAEFRASAYRGKKKLSKKDESTLDEIAKRLNDKLKGPRG